MSLTEIIIALVAYILGVWSVLLAYLLLQPPQVLERMRKRGFHFQTAFSSPETRSKWGGLRAFSGAIWPNRQLSFRPGLFLQRDGRDRPVAKNNLKIETFCMA